eukprot:symbB.v1.2.012234.t1/scaffold837.1/size158912/4
MLPRVLRACGAVAPKATGLRQQALRPLLCPVQQRCFSLASAAKVAKDLQAEIGHEEEQYQPAKELKKFMESTNFKFVEKEGDVNMHLEKELGDKLVKVEWQLTSPFDPTADMEGDQEGGQEYEATDFCVTIESKSGAGMSFYCSTQTGEDHRYVIGNVKSFATTEERESVSSYNGPEFEDVDEKLQESFDELLAEVGVNAELCDFIDAMALDKEISGRATRIHPLASHCEGAHGEVR